MPQRVTTARFICAALMVIAFSACGAGDDSSSATATATGVTTESDAEAAVDDAAPDAESSDTDTTGGEPTGRLILDGQTWELTFDAADPNALCQQVADDFFTVSGMRTPEGNRVDMTVQNVPRDNAMATYFGDDEIPLWSAATDGSSTPPDWSVDGTTVQLSGKWFNRLDPSLDEVEGTLVVSC